MVYTPPLGENLKRGRGIFFVGDASGATDALLGEGIYYAVRQAHILAECLVSDDPQKCYRKKLKPLEREFFFGYLTGFLAYNFQKLMFKHATKEDLKLFFKFLRGEIDFGSLFLYGARRFVRSLFPF